jgi:hypothetical protein
MSEPDNRFSADSGPVKNTDREIYHTPFNSVHDDSIHVTPGGGIGINVAGNVIVKPLRGWHALASIPTDAQAVGMRVALEEIQKIGGPIVARIARDALAAQPPGAPVEAKPFSAKENLREVVAGVRAEIDALERSSAGSDYVTVPVVPTEAMWGGLARDIIMWTRFDRPSERSLLKHLTSVGTQIPDWLAAECRDIDHVPPKGSVAAWVYRAMLDARPVTEPQSARDPEAVAAAQQAIMKHPYFIGHAASAFGLANTAIDAYTLALTRPEHS